MLVEDCRGFSRQQPAIAFRWIDLARGYATGNEVPRAARPCLAPTQADQAHAPRRVVALVRRPVVRSGRLHAVPDLS